MNIKIPEADTVKFNPNQAIAAGAKHDICNLIHKVTALFDEYRMPRFKHFIDIWKVMKFGYIFCGRQTFRELYEFTEDLFDLVKLQAMPPNKFSHRAAAIYLLYALYFKQPARPLIRIKVTMKEYTDLSTFIDKCRIEKHYDLAYVWVKLMTDNAFHFVAAERPYGIDTINSVELRRSAGLLCGINTKFRSNESPFKSDDFINKMQRLNQIHSAYTRMKVALREDPNCPNARLSIAAENFPNMLKEIYDSSTKLLKHVEQETGKGNVLEDEEGKTIGNRRKQLRDKFYGQEGTSYREQNILRNKDEIDIEHGSELISGEIQPTDKIKRSKKPHSARFFDLDCSVDLESFESTKPKYLKQKEKKRKKVEDREKRKLDSIIKEENSTRKKRRTKDEIDFSTKFKKQQKKINAKRKASISASINETIEEVIEVEDATESQKIEKQEGLINQS